ncbi:hypothetical protein [Streptomyces sp. NPDC001389]|uniref:hypothetical protein n=1 Tax=Streptomyces sp. NPDC001389 TaxID=3364569 RepID=UPI00369C80F1
MQHATPEAYRAEAREYRQTAAWHEKAGRTALARRFRLMADDCDERAAALENPNR